MKKQIPVILITGYLGSGKTTLLNNILNNRQGTRYAVIVNDIGEVNIDASLIQRGGVVGSKDGADDLVPLQNGCICCTLKMDLVEQLTQLVDANKFDCIVIEASGICEPGPIAQTICSIPQMPEVYHRNGIPVLKSIVTVVDALRMVDEFDGGDALADNSAHNVDDDIQSLVVEQIEFCNVVLLNKISEISTAQAYQLMQTVQALQPHARIIECDYADVPLNLLMPEGEFSFEKVATSAGWVSLLEAKPTEEEEHMAHHPHGCKCGCHDHDHHHEHDHEHEHHHEHGHDCHCHDCHTDHGGGIDTFVYYRRDPFSIHALDRFMATQWPKNIIRTKGILYFEHQPDMSFLFETAGRQKKLTEAGLWYATAPADELRQLMEQEPGLKQDWDPVYGDRMIKLVFIGKNLDRDALSRNLDACLTPFKK